MNKKIIIPTSNISEGVEFFLRGAKKRRSMAMSNAQMMHKNAEMPKQMVMVK